jgi:BirA family transcriptional regulator, biotin operon repressor / biotin---[acetyl-CoA-carboxylase] ligase
MARAFASEERIVEFLDLLKENTDYASGQSLAQKTGISRSAVWKHIRKLRRLGYNIESLHGRGYRFAGETEYPIPWELARVVKTSFVGKTIIYKETTTSTQNIALTLAEKNNTHGTAVIAEQQTGGRGRLKRKWLSPRGGIWISVILRPTISTAASTMLPFVAAVAVCDAVREATGLDATLKWPNDVMVKGKKVAGILLDLSAEAETINYAVIGIGINANVESKKMRLEREGRPAVTSLSDELGHNVNRLYLTGLLMEKLEKYLVLLEEKGPSTMVTMWRQRTDMLGRRVLTTQQGKEISGTAKDVANDGALIIASAAGDVRVVSGDVIVSY